MKRLCFVLALSVALTLGAVSPALAGNGNQGGISGPVPDEVAEMIGTSYLQLWGANFFPGSAIFSLYPEGGGCAVGTASFRITWCQGFIGYRINVPSLPKEAVLTVYSDGEVVVVLDPVSLAGKPGADGLHAEGWITFADVADAWRDAENPSGMPYPGIMPLYAALRSGDARIVVTTDMGSVTGAVD